MLARRLLVALLAFVFGGAVQPLEASGTYSRNGPYLDYATLPPLGKHGEIPKAQYSFGSYYTPVTVAQYGLQAAADYNATGRRIYRADALRAANWLVRHQRKDGAWRYGFEWTLAPYPALAKGWISGMAQGQALSLLWRANRLKHRLAYRRAAVKALAPLRRPVVAGGVVSDFDGVPWYEEYPTQPGSHVLNGFLFTLLGLYDAVPWSTTAARLLRHGIRSLRSRIGRFERPGGSEYLPGRPATEYYHRVHVTLLGALLSVMPSRTLSSYYARWYTWSTD